MSATRGVGYQHVALPCREFVCILGCFIVSIAVQEDTGTPIAHSIDLDARCVASHYDVGVDIELRGRKRYTLRVVTSRGRNHASGAFLGSELYHFVVRATQLERVDRLQVFAFERHLLIESL